jgi:hypothetical protein
MSRETTRLDNVIDLTRFSFKSEPIWILVFSLAPFVFGLLAGLISFLVIKLLR